jgi:phosphoribosylglycinamide formyltransferase-1
MRARLVVLVSGTGTNLQALLDASADPAFGAEVVAVGADRSGVEALARAERARVPTFTHRVKDYPSRADWDRALAASCAAARPDLIVLAGFMKLVGPPFLDAFAGRVINTHPALLPAFPGMHAVRDALEHGVKVTGCTVHFVDECLDAGPIILQAPVPVLDDDTTESLSARILLQEHRIYSEAIRIVLEGKYRIEGRRVVAHDSARPQ